MQYGCSNTIFMLINLLCFSLNAVEGKPFEDYEKMKSTINTLRHDIHRVLHFIDHFNKDVIQNKETDGKGLHGDNYILFCGNTTHRLFSNTFEPKLSIRKPGSSSVKSDKNRSGIPYQLNHLLSDESVIKATAKQAAKAVADSTKATLKTQQGVKKIAKGLTQLKNCLQTFERTITV